MPSPLGQIQAAVGADSALLAVHLSPMHPSAPAQAVFSLSPWAARTFLLFISTYLSVCMSICLSVSLSHCISYYTNFQARVDYSTKVIIYIIFIILVQSYALFSNPQDCYITLYNLKKLAIVWQLYYFISNN